jgi:hypothetical protein
MSYLLCKYFGHKAPIYAANTLHDHDAEYSTLHICERDGQGRIIACVYADCPRCKEEYIVARIHIPTENDLPDFK